MHKYLILLSVFLSTQSVFANWEVRETPTSSTVAPFGFSRRQPPTGSSVKILDFKIGLEAQQVCGYTDWTTAQLHLPKQLLSKEYWKNVSKKLVDSAKRAVLDLSGALPGMLACNLSPSFCHIFSRAEWLSSQELEFTNSTCEMLSAVENADFLQADSLRQCVKGYTSKGYNPSEAREKCLNNAASSSGTLSKSQKVSQTAKNANDGFSMEKFINKIFPTKVSTATGSYSFNSGGRIYSRRHTTRRIMMRLFPGITVSGGQTITTGGTFQGSLDAEFANEEDKTKNAILEILKEMYKWHTKGYPSNQVIEKSKHVWENKAKWKNDKEPNPIYRATNDGTEPTLLVSPEQILMLIPLADQTKPNLVGKDLEQVLDRLTFSTTHIKMNDHFSDIYTGAIETCIKDPELQNAVAQKNCELSIKKAKSDIEVLRFKRETENNARTVQAEVGSYIRKIQEQRLKRLVPNNSVNRSAPADPIKIPFSIHN